MNNHILAAKLRRLATRYENLESVMRSLHISSLPLTKELKQFSSANRELRRIADHIKPASARK